MPRGRRSIARSGLGSRSLSVMRISAGTEPMAPLRRVWSRAAANAKADVVALAI
jgi:hypothetical protein